MKDFKELLETAKSRGAVKISVAVAEDREVLEALKAATAMGLVEPILVGSAEKIRSIMKAMSFEAAGTDNIRIIDEPDETAATATAVELVSSGEAQVLMKGLVNSAIFLKAVLNPETGLRSGRVLSHFAAFEVPGEKKLMFHSDGGMNIAPDLDTKVQILSSAVEALHKLGIPKPNVAALAANEKVSPKQPVTLDGAALMELCAEGKLPECQVEGPIAMDVAARRHAAEHKGIQSKISGDVDLFLMPSIEAGNIAGKILVNYAGAKIAGAILGATHPIVMVSRADNAEAKLNSIALAGQLASMREPVISSKGASV